MKRVVLIIPFLAITLNFSAQTVLFDYFKYSGNDDIFNEPIDENKEYRNPILSGFYPDPSICRVDSQYYLVNSSFSYFPGIPIFRSNDLVNWEQIGHVLNRPSQLNLQGLGTSDGIYAPSIHYHEGTFYVITTLVRGGGNFYVTANDPTGQWSDPIWIKEVGGIDPSFFFDDDGKTYIINNDAPEGTPLYNGHRAIWIRSYDIQTQKITGEAKVIVNGGTDIKKKPIWIEGPHIFKKDGFYYLIAAEGGTEENHSEVVFRSKNVMGPYDVYKNNPVLTQRHLDPNRKNPITCTGHADFVQLPNNEWWAVFLACRPYSGNHFNTGRETFLLPVTWNKGWPHILKGDQEVATVHKAPLPMEKNQTHNINKGNFTETYHFNKKTLEHEWNFIRTLNERWYFTNADTGYLGISARNVALYDKNNPSFVGRRQQHTNFTASTSMTLTLAPETFASGLVAFQNEGHYYFLGTRFSEGTLRVFLEKSSEKPEASNLLAEVPVMLNAQKDIHLKIVGRGEHYDFYYSLDGDTWNLVADKIDASFLSTTIAGGFVGVYIGMYASSAHFK